MILLVIFLLFVAAATTFPTPEPATAQLSKRADAQGPFTTSGRFIIDSNGKRFKLRCVNWAGHGETNIPEGLQHQSVDYITSWIAANEFNCVRLTYSIDMALNPNITVQQSFDSSAAAAGVGLDDMKRLYSDAVDRNPFLSSATVLETFQRVIESLASNNVKVVLDNHVSRAQWCCSQDDGNGWFSIPGVSLPNDQNSKYFNIENWQHGLQAMASFARSQPNVMAMSLRNELRPLGNAFITNQVNWYKYITQGARTISATNPDLLIVLGGLNYATDLSFLGSNPLDTSQWPNKTVWEFHWYSYTYPTNSCSAWKYVIGKMSGYLLSQNKPYTGPLWLSEFGTDMGSPDTNYLGCVSEYMTGNDADWAVWALQGSYYIRQGSVENEETWGLLDKTWTDWRNRDFPGMLGGMWDVHEGP